MNQYLSKITDEIVNAYQLTRGNIDSKILADERCEAVEGDYMIARGNNNKEISKRVFELFFIKIN